MRPMDLYALPTTGSLPWQRAWRSFEAFFGEALELFDGGAEGAPDVAFAEKLHHPGDGERSISVAAVLFEGGPIGCVLAAGRGERDREVAIVTDEPAFRRAVRALDAVRRGGSPRDVRGADEDAPELDGYGSWVVHADGAGTRIADLGHLTGDGVMLFDEGAFRDALDRIVRPAFLGASGLAQMAPGLRSMKVRCVAAWAVLAGVPPHLAPSAVEADRGDAVAAEGWWPVRVATPAGEYRVGVPAGRFEGHLAWARNVVAERVGGEPPVEDPTID